MARGKQRKETRSVENVSPSERDLLLEDDGWVIVKKQTITILVPSLPISEKTIPSDPGPSPLEDLTEATTSNKHLPPTENTSSPNRKVSASPLHHPSETCKLLKTSKTSSKVVKQREGFTSHSCSLPTVSFLVKQRLRTRNLERKLESAGGLSRWLMSLGLGQFVRMFERRSVNKFQLAGLTMQKLKDMGSFPVGPRRKLMHAIECCCEPCHT